MLRATLRAMMLLTLLLSLSLVAHGAIIHVPADQPTIQAAGDAAADGDIILLADGFYPDDARLILSNIGVTIQSESGNPDACIVAITGISSENSDSRLHAITVRGITFPYGASVGAETNALVTVTASKFGGILSLGVHGNAHVTITDSTFDGSQSGIYCNGVAGSSSLCLIKNCSFTNGTSNFGTITNWYGNVAVANCTFADNVGFNDGGAIGNIAGNLTVTNSTFVHNTAVMGGAVSGESGSTTLINCTFAYNQSDQGAGAVYHVNDHFYPDGGLHIANCLFWGNSAPSGLQLLDEDPSLSQVANSLIQDFPGLTGTPDANGNFTADPLFVRNPSPGPDGQLGTSDDDLGDLHLLFGSPAIDAGNNALLPPDTADLNNNGDTTEPLPIDLDGKPRISRARVDLGAYEYQNPPPPVEVTGSVSIKAGGFTAAGGSNYTQTLTLTNTGSTAITGPIYLLLDNLGGANVQLTNLSGTTVHLTPTGRPYITLTSGIVSQGSTKVILKFSNPSKTLISCTLRVFAGPGSM